MYADLSSMRDRRTIIQTVKRTWHEIEKRLNINERKDKFVRMFKSGTLLLRRSTVNVILVI